MSANNGPVYDAAAVASLLGIPQTQQDLAAFGPPPQPLPEFLTFFDPGWCILRLREAAIGKSQIFYPQSWYDDEAFARCEVTPRYRQLHLEAVRDSFGKSFAEQMKLLAANEEVPLAREVVTGMSLHFLATGGRMFPHYWVRCLDRDSGGSRVFVGRFDRDGLVVSSCLDGDSGGSRVYVGLFDRDGRVVSSRWDVLLSSGVGLAPSRKF